MNGYFYAMCLSVAACTAAMALIARRARYSATIGWFQVYLAGIVAFNTLELNQFFNSTAGTHIVIISLIGLTAPVIFTSQLVFIMHFVGKSHWMKRWWVMATLFGAGMAFLFIAWNFHGYMLSDSITSRIWKPWGYVDTTRAPGFGLVSAYTGIIALIGWVALIVALIKARSQDRRRQVLIVMTAVIVPTVIGVAVQGVLPQKGIYIPPIGSYSTTIAALLIGLMLVRYGTGSIDPEAITASIVQTMNSPAVALDRNHRITFANAATSSLLGYDQTEIINKPINDLFGAESGQKLAEYLRSNQKSTAGNQTFESHVIAHDGKQTAVNVYSSYYRDKRGEVVATILVLADVQRLQDLKASVEQTVVERTHQLHQEQAKLLASIEGLPSGFALVDRQQNIVLQNQSLRTIFGLDDSTVTVDKLGTHLSGVDLDDLCRQVQEQKQPMVLGEVGLGAKILRLFLGPVRVKEDGAETIIGVVMLAEDITEEKIIARSKDEFFSIASHELRTPLTSIKGNTAMLMTYFPAIMENHDVKEIITDVHDSSIRLIDIVNDCLDVSRLEQGKIAFTYAAFSLESVVEKIVYEMQHMLDEKKLYLKFDKMTLDSLPKIWADENRTKQVLYNLIGNAAKFTEGGGISISAKAEGKQIKVLVSDTGRGMSPANQQLLFHKFQQANTSLLTRDTSRGTGLGLYISKMIVENMGGTIKLESSQEGKGSTFSFTLPIATGVDAQHSLDKAKNGKGKPRAVVTSPVKP
jgi:PAS domain S-box-containing protein